jgi:DNA-binding HxlR family transcriptional regulator
MELCLEDVSRTSSPALVVLEMPLEAPLCPVDTAARIIGQKWTLQIVYHMLDRTSVRFCELQDELGGVNPGTLSARLKMLEEEGLVHRVQVSNVPPHVEYSLTDMGKQMESIIRPLITWSNTWLCACSAPGGGC